MRQEIVPHLIPTTDLETSVAILRKKAKQARVMLPEHVALYIAQNLQSNAHAQELALMRLMAHSSMTGTEITLTYTQRVLKNFIDAQARTAGVDLVQELPFQQFSTKEAKFRRKHPTATTHHFIFSLLKARDGGKTSRVRHELEVNMRESERERLARRDAYERDLECCTKKRKQA